MDNVRDALLRMVRAARDSKRLQEAFLDVGLKDNMIFNIYGNIAESIYKLIGEHTESIEESVTSLVLTTPLLTEDRRVEMLMAEYKKNNPVQPSPNTIDHDEMKKMYKQNGGYLRETPEGDWS